MIEEIGKDVFLGKYIEITRPNLAKVGNHTAIDSFFYCTTALDIGDYVHIAPQVCVIGGGESKLTLEHFSFIATGSRLVCGSEDYTSGGLIGSTIPKQFKAPTKIAPIKFEMFSGVGANCVIMPGVVLAKGSMVGAGAVVTKSTEPWGIYVGNPAKLLKFKSNESIQTTLNFAKQLGYDI